MFNRLKIFLSTFAAAVGVWAQDVIVMRDGSEVQALVFEVGVDAIKYKKYNFQDGPYFYVSISKVIAIKHRNGDRDVFDVKENPPVPQPQPFYVPFYVPQPDVPDTSSTDVSAQTTQIPQGSIALESTGGAAQQATDDIASSGQQIAVKQPVIDADYEKRQKRVVKFTGELEKIEKALAEVKQSAPATYEVAKLSVDLLKLLNRTQEKKTFESDELLPLIVKATLMTLPPQVSGPLKTNTDLAVKTFSFLTVDFKLPKDRAAGVIGSALKSWNGASVLSIKDEIKTVPPAQKLKAALLLKYSIGVFATVIPQLNVTVKASL